MVSPSRRHVLKFVGAASVTLLPGCAVQEALPGEDPTGHLYVRNRMDEDQRVAITVTDTSNGERILDAKYRIPPEHVLHFTEVLASGNTYAIQVLQPDIEGAGEGQLSVTAETCQEGDPSEKMDVAVLITTHGPDIIPYDCDEAYDRDADLTYVEPAEYWIGTPTPVD